MKLAIVDPAGNPHFSALNLLLECPLTKRRNGAQLVPLGQDKYLEIVDYTGRAADAAALADAIVLTFGYAFKSTCELLVGAEGVVIVDQQGVLDPLELMGLGMGGLRVVLVETSTALVATLRAVLGMAPGTDPLDV